MSYDMHVKFTFRADPTLRWVKPPLKAPKKKYPYKSRPPNYKKETWQNPNRQSYIQSQPQGRLGQPPTHGQPQKEKINNKNNKFRPQACLPSISQQFPLFVILCYVSFSIAVSSLHIAGNIKKKIMNRNRGKTRRGKRKEKKNSVMFSLCSSSSFLFIFFSFFLSRVLISRHECIDLYMASGLSTFFLLLLLILIFFPLFF